MIELAANFGQREQQFRRALRQTHGIAEFAGAPMAVLVVERGELLGVTEALAHGLGHHGELVVDVALQHSALGAGAIEVFRFSPGGVALVHRRKMVTEKAVSRGHNAI